MKKRYFEIMMIVGTVGFMFMLAMALFIDFTKLELAIPLIIGIIGHVGTEIIKREMKKRSNRIRVRRMRRRAY